MRYRITDRVVLGVALTACAACSDGAPADSRVEPMECAPISCESDPGLCGETTDGCGEPLFCSPCPEESVSPLDSGPAQDVRGGEDSSAHAAADAGWRDARVVDAAKDASPDVSVRDARADGAPADARIDAASDAADSSVVRDAAAEAVSCLPESDAAFCSRLSAGCGAADGRDNCGQYRSVASCMVCATGMTCGGGGDPKSCGIPGIREGIVSKHGKPGARYMWQRRSADLQSVGALSQVQQRVVLRLSSYGQSLSVDGLLFAEDPSRFATFLADEQAAFPSLWETLEVAPNLDLLAPPVWTPLESIVERTSPTAARYDETSRVAISGLHTNVQDAARRLVKPAGADPSTIAFADVLTGLANYALYPSTEYAKFGPLLWNLELLFATPSSFPTLRIKEPLAGALNVSVGRSTMTITRAGDVRCAGAYNEQSSVSATQSIVFAAPVDEKLVWVPLSDGAILANRDYYSSGTDVYVFPADYPRPPYLMRGLARAVGILEAYRGGARVGQTSVVLFGDSAVSAPGHAIGDATAFSCTPYAYVLEGTQSLSNVGRLPPGQYRFAVPSHGDATLDLFGQGMARMTLSGVSVDAYFSRYAADYRCWEFSALRDPSDPTRTPGPGLRLDLDTSRMMYFPSYYSACSSQGSGTAVATLRADDRL